MQDCDVDVIYALSPAAKGKIERPYRWLQDPIVRRCAEAQVTHIEPARAILYEAMYRYNNKRVHSITGEIPRSRYEKAIEDHLSVMRPFTIKPPLQIREAIFCYRYTRQVNAYHKISFHRLEFVVHDVPLYS